MNLIEAYLFLFADSFISGLILPAKQAIVLPAMRIFGGYNNYLITLIYSGAISLAACANWLLGKILRSLKKDMPGSKNNKASDKIFIFLRKYGYLGGLLGFIPVIGPIAVILSGLASSSFVRTIVLVFIVNLIFSW